ncbi:MULTISPECIES: M48 family metallopeptidase [Methanobacterium]|uniref:M48 family metallopeptidase n=1 Tax=Methanobacterium veterum TaxID=408577 RepID=A0A9E5DLD2_9EURY|nr:MULTISPECIES: M48 family metallopeptidase [Methanobacterium]MCZ3366539.1 M48 family metallopeptidase [Methanobacterium veterum]MCZ3371752.1 M48 family metallopeptidase [Methanobacterium veterum]
MPNRFKIKDLEGDYQVVRRDIKYPRLELKTGNLILIVPKKYKQPQKLIEEHQEWIYNKFSLIKESKERANKKKLNHQRTEEKLRELVSLYVKKDATKLGAMPSSVRFRNMNSKWGSCSNKKTLTLNKLLKYLPYDLIEYVVYHEMVHLIERKHNKNFWKIISDKFTDYKQKEDDLMDYWFLINSNIKNRRLYNE